MYWSFSLYSIEVVVVWSLMWELVHVESTPDHCMGLLSYMGIMAAFLDHYVGLLSYVGMWEPLQTIPRWLGRS